MPPTPTGTRSATATSCSAWPPITGAVTRSCSPTPRSTPTPGSRGWAARWSAARWTTSGRAAAAWWPSARSSAAGSSGTPTTPTCSPPPSEPKLPPAQKWPHLRRRGRSEHRRAVHLAERVGDELDPRAVGVAEVHRDAAVHLVRHAGLGEPLHELVPAVGVDADRHVVEAAQHLGVRADVQAGEVEEREQVPVADVEEEVRRTRVVAVLDQLGQREAEHVLVEAHGPLHVAADQRRVVQAAGRGGRAFPGGAQVRVADAGRLGLDRVEVAPAGGGGHVGILPPRPVLAEHAGRWHPCPRSGAAHNPGACDLMVRMSGWLSCASWWPAGSASTR